MANTATITALIPTLFSSFQTVSREMVGAIKAVSTNFDDKGVAADGSSVVTVPVADVVPATTYTPAMTPGDGSASTALSVTLNLSNTQMGTWELTGEQERALQNGGDNAMEWFRQKSIQAMRTLANNIEANTALTLANYASRATGTAATTPFGTDQKILADLARILDDNGAPATDRSLVLGNAAVANLRKNVTLVSPVYPGTPGLDVLQRGVDMSGGVLTSIYGFDVRASAGPVLHTKGTGASITSTTAGYAVGTTVINVIGGTGTVVVGDSGTFTGDSNIYQVVASTVTAGSGIVTIASPGLRVALPASAVAMTIGGSYTPSMALYRGAAILVVRPPIIPANPLIQQTILTDPATGLSFLVCRVAGDGKTVWRVHAVYNSAVVNQSQVALLLG